jgi:isoprenylcysteine carboxyl methyltransferase (ICMT) family protein YpbQ
LTNVLTTVVRMIKLHQISTSEKQVIQEVASDMGTEHKTLLHITIRYCHEAEMQSC